MEKIDNYAIEDFADIIKDICSEFVKEYNNEVGKGKLGFIKSYDKSDAILATIHSAFAASLGVYCRIEMTLDGVLVLYTEDKDTFDKYREWLREYNSKLRKEAV